MKGDVTQITKDILLKAEMRDVIKITDSKPNKDDFEESLKSIYAELQDKIEQKVLYQQLDEQALINEALCAENCLGRWIWKSGEVKSQGLIPWEI